MKADKLLGHLTLLILITLIGAGMLTPILRADQAVSSLSDWPNQKPLQPATPTDGEAEVVEWTVKPANVIAAPALSASPEKTDAGQLARPEPTLTADCRALERATATLLQAQVNPTEARFTDKFTARPVARCQLTVTDAKKASDVEKLAADLRATLEARGWQEDPTYIAFGLNEMSLALQHEQAAAFLQISWQPEQQVYTILLEQTPLPQ